VINSAAVKQMGLAVHDWESRNINPIIQGKLQIRLVAKPSRIIRCRRPHEANGYIRKRTESGVLE
jgi:hypothetical protein